VALPAEGHVEAHQLVLVDECPHPLVGEPQVVAPDPGAGLLDAGGVEELAAAGTGDEVLVRPGSRLAENLIGSRVHIRRNRNIKKTLKIIYKPLEVIISLIIHP
jgi:hypothetical protein